MTNLAKYLITSVVFGSSFNCCTALGKSLSLRLPLSLPWYHMSFLHQSAIQRLQFLMIFPFYYCSVMGININKLATSSFLLLFFLSASCVHVEGGGREGGGEGELLCKNVSTRKAIYLQTQFSSLSSNINCRAIQLIVWFDLNKGKPSLPKSS